MAETRVRVSTVLSELKLVDERWYTESGRERGNLVHWIGEQVLSNKPVTVSPSVRGYRDAIAAGRDALGWEPLIIEERLTYRGVTGRIDSFGRVTKQVLGKGYTGYAVLDIKSGAPALTHPIQLAMYEELLHETGRASDYGVSQADVVWHVGLYVKPTGDYRLEVYTDPEATIVARAALALTRWRITHGLIGEQPEIVDPKDWK